MVPPGRPSVARDPGVAARRRLREEKTRSWRGRRRTADESSRGKRARGVASASAGPSQRGRGFPSVAREVEPISPRSRQRTSRPAARAYRTRPRGPEASEPALVEGRCGLTRRSRTEGVTIPWRTARRTTAAARRSTACHAAPSEQAARIESDEDGLLAGAESASGRRSGGSISQGQTPTPSEGSSRMRCALFRVAWGSSPRLAAKALDARVPSSMVSSARRTLPETRGSRWSTDGHEGAGDFAAVSPDGSVSRTPAARRNATTTGHCVTGEDPEDHGHVPDSEPTWSRTGATSNSRATPGTRSRGGG